MLLQLSLICHSSTSSSVLLFPLHIQFMSAFWFNSSKSFTNPLCDLYQFPQLFDERGSRLTGLPFVFHLCQFGITWHPLMLLLLALAIIIIHHPTPLWLDVKLIFNHMFCWSFRKSFSCFLQCHSLGFNLFVLILNPHCHMLHIIFHERIQLMLCCLTSASRSKCALAQSHSLLSLLLLESILWIPLFLGLFWKTNHSKDWSLQFSFHLWGHHHHCHCHTIICEKSCFLTGLLVCFGLSWQSSSS